MSMKIIPQPVKRWASSHKTATFLENTFFAMSVETALKAVGRPTFILLDKEADSKEKKRYAATKEVLYQGLCFTLYIAAMPFVKKGIYKGLSAMVKKGGKVAEGVAAYNNAHNIFHEAEAAYKKSGSFIKRLSNSLGLKKDSAIQAAKKQLQEAEEIFNINKVKGPAALGKGLTEVSAILGSILMLTIAAPQISHFIIHPIMNKLGFKSHESTGAQVQKK